MASLSWLNVKSQRYPAQIYHQSWNHMISMSLIVSLWWPLTSQCLLVKLLLNLPTSYIEFCRSWPVLVQKLSQNSLYLRPIYLWVKYPYGWHWPFPNVMRPVLPVSPARPRLNPRRPIGCSVPEPWGLLKVPRLTTWKFERMFLYIGI